MLSKPKLLSAALRIQVPSAALISVTVLLPLLETQMWLPSYARLLGSLELPKRLIPRSESDFEVVGEGPGDFLSSMLRQSVSACLAWSFHHLSSGSDLGGWKLARSRMLVTIC
jgi:hypothetical protein